MSSYGLLTVGDIVVSELRDGVHNELLAVFRDEWLVTREMTVGEWDPVGLWTDEDPAEPVQ